MNLIKTSYFTFFSTFVKLLSSLFLNKAIAIFVGPQGLAIIGQFQNFSQLAMIVSQGGINNGIIKYAAEYPNDSVVFKKMLNTASLITISCSLFFGFFIAIFCKYESIFFLNDIKYYYVFLIFGITLVFYSFNTFFLSILNGIQDVANLTKINIYQSIITLLISLLLIRYWGISGVLIALVTNQSVIFILLFIFFRKHWVFSWNFLRPIFDHLQFQKLLKFSLMSIVSAIITPLSLIIIRSDLQSLFGNIETGYWQAVWYISTMHLMVITTTLSVYFLPKLSSIHDNILLRKELLTGFKLIFPFVVVTSISIFFLKDILVQILFTSEFTSIKKLLLIQLTGDIFKILSWLLSYLMIAKAMTTLFVLSEFLFVGFFIFLSYFLSRKLGLIGMSYAYLVNYIFYFIFLVFSFRKILFVNLIKF